MNIKTVWPTQDRDGHTVFDRRVQNRLSYCGENVHIAKFRVFDAIVDGISLALQFFASE